MLPKSHIGKSLFKNRKYAKKKKVAHKKMELKKTKKISEFSKKSLHVAGSDCSDSSSVVTASADKTWILSQSLSFLSSPENKCGSSEEAGKFNCLCVGVID